MTLARQYRARCDECGAQSADWQDTPRHARAAARHAGWVSVSQARISNYARIDYCPECAGRQVTAEGEKGGSE